MGPFVYFRGVTAVQVVNGVEKSIHRMSRGGEDRLPTTTSPVDRYCNALEQSSFSIVAIRLINRM